MKKWLILLGLLVFANSALAEMRVDVSASVKQGGVMRISLKSEDDVRYPILVALYTSGNDIPLFKAKPIMLDENNFFTFIPINVHQEPGEYRICTFVLPNTLRCDEIKIQKVDFPESKNVSVIHEPDAAKKAKRQKELDEINDVYRKITPARYWDENLRFAEPLALMAVTSPFGQVRHKKYILRNGKVEKYDRPHYGSDLRADVGTSVFAAEAGIVRIAKYFSAEGNFVVIDHGFGLLTLYMHLSKIKVKEGQIVKRGEEISKSGQTATKNSPHLHFEVRLSGVAVSPWEFMPEPLFAEPKIVLPQKRGVK